jgi:hypothetical protein
MSSEIMKTSTIMVSSLKASGSAKQNFGRLPLLNQANPRPFGEQDFRRCLEIGEMKPRRIAMTGDS